MWQLQKLKTKSNDEYLIPESTPSLPRPRRWQQTDNLPTVPTMFHHHNKSCPNLVMNQCVIQACITLPVADPDRVTRFLEPGQNFQIWMNMGKITFREGFLTQNPVKILPRSTTDYNWNAAFPPPPPSSRTTWQYDTILAYLSKITFILEQGEFDTIYVCIITHEVSLLGLLTPSWNKSWHTVLSSI